MNKCALDYFTARPWVVLADPAPVEEEAGHILLIKDQGKDTVMVQCGAGHPFYSGVYIPEKGAILDSHPEKKWMILCVPGLGRARDRIVYGPTIGLPTGSWTAEDNGGVGGDGD